MSDREIVLPTNAISEITPELKVALNETKSKLKAIDRRRFMAQIVKSLGIGGQRRVQRELGWSRNTIIKGLKELNSGIHCYDNFSGRGRKRSEHHLPHLLDDIKAIVEPVSQVDPTFRTDQNYCPLTAGEVRRRLIEEKNYSIQQLPKERTIRSSHRTQFIKRIVEFAQRKKIDVSLAYYPPYHSKYNPVERVWGVLESIGMAKY